MASTECREFVPQFYKPDKCKNCFKEKNAHQVPPSPDNGAPIQTQAPDNMPTIEILTPLPNYHDVLLARPVTLQIQCSGGSIFTAIWFFNDLELKNSNKYRMESRENIFSMTIHRCNPSDDGIYRVRITNGIDSVEQTTRLNIKVKPKIEATESSNKQSCIVGADTQISWRFSGIEKPEVKWLFNEQTLPSDERFQIIENDDGTSTLSIRATEFSDEGLYTARATNSVGTIEAKTELHILGIKPVIINDLEDALESIKGESVTMKLNINGKPQPNVIWMKGDDRILSSDNIQITVPTNSDDDTYILTILNVQPNDQGEYFAKISNSAGSIKSKKCTVTVMKPPVFFIKPTSQTVKQSEKAVFEVKFDGYPFPKITWLLDDKALTSKGNLRIETDPNTGDSQLSIDRIDMEQHKGVITCRIENIHGSAEEIAQLGIRAAPMIRTDLNKEEEVVCGKDTILKIVAVGSPRPQAQWYYNDNSLMTSNVVYDEVTNEYQLMINEASFANNEGRYRIALKNELGQCESTTCTLRVLRPVKLVQVVPNSSVLDLKVGQSLELSFDIDGNETPKVKLSKNDHAIEFIHMKDGKYTYRVDQVKPGDEGIYKLTAMNKISREESSITINVTAPLEISQSLPDHINVLLDQSTTLQIKCDGYPIPTATWFFNDVVLKDSTKYKIQSRKNTFFLVNLKCELSDDGIYRVRISDGIDHIDQTTKLNVKSAPKVEAIEASNEQSCIIGTDTQISWRFSGIEKPKIVWLFNGQSLSINNRFQTIETDDGTSTLSIRTTELDDKGVYTVRATNSVGEVEAKTILRIISLKPIIISDLQDTLKVSIGKSMRMVLIIKGIPRPDIIWMKNNNELIPNESIQFTISSTDDSNTYTLTILDVYPNDRGEYFAEISNLVGSITSNKCTVTAMKLPMFLMKSMPQEANQGEKAMFQVKIDGYPLPDITWLLNDEILTPADNVQIEIDQNTGDSKLSIDKVDLEQHRGVVTCRIENIHGRIEERTRLKIRAAPMIKTQLNTKEEVPSGSDITLKVVVVGSPRPEAQWYYNDEPLETGNVAHDEIKNEYRLAIVGASFANNDGRYRVVLMNELGECKSTICELRVLENVILVRALPTSDVITMKVGEPLELCFDIDGNEKPKVKLYKNGGPVEFTHVEGRRYVYKVDEMKPEDEGEYKVIAKNKISIKEMNIAVNVIAPLVICQPLADNIDAVLDQATVIPVKCNGYPIPTAKWFFNDIELKNSNRHTIQSKENTFSLFIHQCNHSDSGIYRVHITNGIDSVEQTTTVNVRADVTSPRNEQSCIIGEDTQISVAFNNDEKAQFIWLFNGQSLSNDERFQIIENDDGTSTLSIQATEFSDEGLYTARMINALGTKEANIKLNILGIKPAIVNGFEETQQVTKGESIRIQLNVVGKPRPDVTWMKDDRKLVLNENIQITAPTLDNNNTYTLTILNIQPNDQGEYFARISNMTGSIKSKKCTVTVMKPPVFLIKPTSQNVKQGEKYIFKIKIDGCPFPKIKWLLNGKIWISNDNVQIETDPNTGDSELSIPSADIQQYAGSLTCRIENIHGSAEEVTQLDIHAAPMIQTDLNQEEEIISGKDITLKVVAFGLPQPQAQWYYNDNPLETSNVVCDEVTNEYRLMIKEASSANHEGRYRVVLTNELGECKSTICELRVLEQVKLVRITPTSDVVAMKVGEPLELCFDIYGNEKPKVKLYKNGGPVGFTHVEGRRYVYKVDEMKPEDEGEYKVIAENRISTKEMNIAVTTIIDVDTPQENHVNEEKNQATLKAYYDSFPNIDDTTDKTTPDIKKAEEFTKSILNNKPSGNVTERDTVCHVLSQLFTSQDQQCLFYDSANGINLHDASGNLADISSQEKPFVLKLNSSEGLGGNNDPTSEQNDVKLAEILNNVIQKNETHPVIEDIRDRLAKAHGVDKECIVIQNVYAGTFNVVYTVIDLAQQVVEKVVSAAQKLKTQFDQFLSAKIHPLLYRPSFDISLFDARGNKTFGIQPETHQVGPSGKTKPYTTPSGWTRYGLKVLGKKNQDDYWLHPFGHAGNWYRAFHGTGSAQSVDFSGSNAYSEQQYASVDALASIFTTEFRKARVHVHGEGVYCSPNPKFPEKDYVNVVQLDTKQGPKKFKCMLQVAVNPKGVKFTKNNDIWVVPDPKDIRPYGILIKEA